MSSNMTNLALDSAKSQCDNFENLKANPFSTDTGSQGRFCFHVMLENIKFL